MQDLNLYFKFKDTSCKRIDNDDIPYVVNLINKEYSYQDEYRNKTRTSIKHLSELIESTEFYVFTKDDSIIGCVYIEFQEAYKPYFGLLTVSKEFQGRGLGRQITKSVEQYCKSVGSKELLLAYMHIEPWLKDYYTKMGFKENGDVWDWDGIKLINMSKKL
ncbi:MAG: GNAT family N-acetyltransferase [Patescibacteria group bacterium]|jgi:predicted GNAT family N-acyltransferase|nr:GNAT family N-acetyltransferase [Patescibacteria group bacterium]